MSEFLNEVLGELGSIFVDPKKRIFIGYLFSALLVAVLWLIFFQRKSLADIKELVFSHSVWFSSSALTDYALLIGNRLIMTLISPLLLGQLVVATYLFESLHHLSAPQPLEAWPVWLVMSLFTVTVFLLDDASRYGLHRLLHQSTVLWRFHRVHHTATNLTPLTIFRSHPVEGVLFSLRSALVQGVCIGGFIFLFGSSVDLLTVFGVNILLFMFNVLGANLRHSPVSMPYPERLERWLISPAQHQLHHSTDPEHFNKNYGVFLAVWDRLGGTLHYSERGRKLDYGIKQGDEKMNQSIGQVYLSPFQENALVMWNHFKRTVSRFTKNVKVHH